MATKKSGEVRTPAKTQAPASAADACNMPNPERERLRSAPSKSKRLGPYLCELLWGTVCEDYSPDGSAGISNHRRLLCFALALRNCCGPILKARLFGRGVHLVRITRSAARQLGARA